jgi:hypothetical protein
MSAYRAFRNLAAIAAAALLGACAHPISIVPDLGTLPATGPAAVERNVAYVVTAANRDMEITTPGGGGDSVRYFPYRELESGLFQALSTVYARVTLLRSAQDTALIEKNGVSLVFLPRITTTSSSTSIFTWPPTDFSVTIAYTVTDASGAEIYKGSVTGTGQADYATFIKDFGIAGKRAALDALRKFRTQVLDSPVGPSESMPGAPRPGVPSAPGSLDDLKGLLPPQ